MTEKYALLETEAFHSTLVKMVNAYARKAETATLSIEEPQSDDQRPPVRFITHRPYSTYVELQYSASEYNPDLSSRAGQKFVRTVDGDKPVPVSIFYLDADGNHKQMITFTGDDINGEIKLILEGHETTPIKLLNSVLTQAYLTAKIEALPNVGKGNVKVSLWPGHWLVEFIGKLSGVSFDPFEIDLPEYAVFDCWALPTDWADSGVDDEVYFTIPVGGKYDGDDNVINDAVAAGSIGEAIFKPAVGLVVMNCQCRDYNGDGTPNL